MQPPMRGQNKMKFQFLPTQQSCSEYRHSAVLHLTNLLLNITRQESTYKVATTHEADMLNKDANTYNLTRLRPTRYNTTHTYFKRRPLTKNWRTFIHLVILLQTNQTSSSAVAERPRDASCLSASIVQNVERKFRFRFTARTNKFCSLLFSSLWSSMLQAVITAVNCMVAVACYSQVQAPARHPLITSYIADDRDLYLHCKRKILKVSNKKYSMHGAYIE